MALKPNVLVLGTSNSCRSQMAEGMLRRYAGDRFSVHSAGTVPKYKIHELAIKVMAEDGIDISQLHPKGLNYFLGRLPIRYLILVCKEADESCPPNFPGLVERIFWEFDDPEEFQGSPEVTLKEFRRIRDEIFDRIGDWLQDIKEQ